MTEQNKNIIKRTWSVLKKTIGINIDKSPITHSFNINNVNLKDKNEIGEAFNNYFSEIGQSTSKSVPNSKRNNNAFLKNPSRNTMSLQPIDTSHVIEAANKLKPKHSRGRDDISIKLF